MRTLAALTLIFVSGFVQAQQKVMLNWSFQPNKVYTTTISNSIDMTMDISGNPDKIKDIKAKGGTFPMKVTGVNDMKLTTTTGRQSSDRSIPLKIVYDKVWTLQKVGDQEKGENSPLTGLVIEGAFLDQKKLRIDTIISENANDALRGALRSTVETMLQQVKFPSTPMKVGDTFDQSIPMSIPVPGMPPIEMTIKTNYKLREITKNLAKFDIEQKVTLDMDVAPVKINVEGQGTGTTDFDFTISTIVDYSAKLDFVMKMLIEDITLTANASSVSKQQVVMK